MFKALSNLKIERWVFLMFLLVHVGIVWSMDAFLTQDGPSHLYNSRIFLDWTLGRHSEIYSEYYVFNNAIFPNWLSSILLSFLLSLFSPLTAEKLFVSILIIGLPLSFRYLLKQTAAQNLAFSSLIFIYTYHYFLFYGFYNFSLSLIFLFVFIGYYFKSKPSLNLKSKIKLSLLCVLTFFTHPVAFLLCVIFIGIEGLEYIDFEKLRSREDLTKLFKKWSGLLLIVCPAVLLFLLFLNQNSETLQILIEKPHEDFQSNFIGLYPLTVFSPEENYIFQAAFYGMGILAIWQFISFCFFEKKLKYGSLIVLFLTIVFLYRFANDKLAGGDYLGIRLSFMAHLILLIWIASQPIKAKLKSIALALSIVLICLVIWYRYAPHKKAGNLVKNYLEVLPYIEEGDRILPLGFSNKGELNDKIWSPNLALFKHISGYLGAHKPLVSFDNYEADNAYFPILWKPSRNPYLHISKNSSAGIEENPPYVDILNYNQKTGGKIDKIILWGDIERYADHWMKKELFRQLKRNFTLIYESEDGWTKLYKVDN